MSASLIVACSTIEASRLRILTARDTRRVSSPRRSLRRRVCETGSRTGRLTLSCPPERASVAVLGCCTARTGPRVDDHQDRPSDGHTARMVHVARAEAIERWSLRRESAPNGESERLSPVSASRPVADGQSSSGLARHQRPQGHYSSAAVLRTAVSGLVEPSAQSPAVRCFRHGCTGV